MLIPLKKFVVECTREAEENDPESIDRACRKWRNKFYHGSIPMNIRVKIGREIFINLENFDKWMSRVGR